LVGFHGRVAHRTRCRHADHRRWHTEDARDFLDRELARLDELRLVRVHTRLLERRPAEQDAWALRTTQTLVAFLECLDQVLGLFAGEVAGELDDAARRRTLTEEPCRELLECARQTQVLFDQVDARLAAHLARQRQVLDVDHVDVFDTVALVVHVEDAAVLVAAHLGVLRIQHRQGQHFAFLVADDASEAVAVQQQRDDDLLEMVLFRDTQIGLVKPRRSRPILETHTFLANVGIDRQS